MPNSSAGYAYTDSGLELATNVAFVLATDYASIGFTLEDLTAADVMHVSVVDHVGNNHVHYRYRDSGAIAAAAVGHVLGTLDTVIIKGNNNINNFSIIEGGGAVDVWITLLTYGTPPA